MDLYNVFRVLDKIPLASVLAVAGSVATVIAVAKGTPLGEALDSLALYLAGCGVIGFVRNQAHKGVDY